MKKVFFAIASVIFAFSYGYAIANVNLDVNTDKSIVKWVGKKVTGQHNGTINFSNGKMKVKDGKLTGGEFFIDMSSIVVLDITDKNLNQKLKGHLESDDFFNAKDYPKAKFAIKSAKFLKSTAQGDNYDVTGEMVIRGKKKTITVPVTLLKTDNDYVAKAKFTLNRADYNVKYNSGSFFKNLGDNLIYDDFELDMEVFFK